MLRCVCLLLAVALGGAVVGACGGDDEDPRPRIPLAAGPAAVRDIVDDQLVIAADPGDAYVTDAVADLDGEVVSTDDKLDLVRVRFDVGNVDDLLKVRDELRSRGVDARVIAALDPGSLGSGSKDDPA